MDELIQQLTSKLGIDSSVATSATNKAMSVVKEKAGDDLFSKISSAIPGAEEAAVSGASSVEEQAPEEDSGGGGMFGKLAGMASGAIGGSAGDAMEMTSKLSGSGLEAGQMGGFASTLVEFIKDKVGDDVVNQLLAKVPMLKSLMG